MLVIWFQKAKVSHARNSCVNNGDATWWTLGTNLAMLVKPLCRTDLCLSLLAFLHFMEKCLFYVTLQSLENNINKEFCNHFVIQRIFQRTYNK